MQGARQLDLHQPQVGGPPPRPRRDGSVRARVGATAVPCRVVIQVERERLMSADAQAANEAAVEPPALFHRTNRVGGLPCSIARGLDQPLAFISVHQQFVLF